MRQRGGGAVINITSNEGVRPSMGIGTYALSKAALINMAQLLGKEWAADKIRVTCIAPGLIRTDLAKDLVEAVETSGSPINPQKRGGRAERNRRFGRIPGQPGRGLCDQHDLCG